MLSFAIVATLLADRGRDLALRRANETLWMACSPIRGVAKGPHGGQRASRIRSPEGESRSLQNGGRSTAHEALSSGGANHQSRGPGHEVSQEDSINRTSRQFFSRPSLEKSASTANGYGKLRLFRRVPLKTPAAGSCTMSPIKEGSPLPNWREDLDPARRLRILLNRS